MITQTTIRQAVPNDHSKLQEIIDLSFPRFFRQFASHSLNSDGTTIVAEVDNVVAGFAKLFLFGIGCGSFGCILWLAVHPNYRQKGVAAKLVDAATSQLLDNGAESVFASVQRRNTASLATFRKEGFKQLGFLGLWRLFGWRVFSFYRKIWFTPGEIILMR